MAALQDSRPWYRKLHWQVLVALALGLIIGAFCHSVTRVGADSSSGWLSGLASEMPLLIAAIQRFVSLAGLLGDLFLRLLKMVIIPLIFTSLVSGIASLGDTRSVGRIGLRTLIYYTVTTTAAILVGLTLVNLISPGVGLNLASSTELPEQLTTSGFSLREFMLRLVPDNVVSAMANGDVLAVITFAILFGIFLTRLDSPAAASVKKVVDGVLEVVQLLTLAVIKLAPVGIFGLLVRVVAESGAGVIIDLWRYFATVGCGLLFHALVTLPLILLLVARRNPFQYFGRVMPALVTAFSTASSSATLPLSMECAEHQAGLPRGISSFVLPLGATVNMDGTALYEAVAALTIAQMYGVSLTLPQQVLVLLTALLASVGAAGIPMAGLVMLVVVLEAVGLPLEGIATIIAVDRVLDMMRTATNVWSDLVGAAVITRLEGSGS